MSRRAIVFVGELLLPTACTSIKQAGYNLTVTDDPREALTILYSHPYDLIVFEMAPQPKMRHCISELRKANEGAILVLLDSADFADAEPILGEADEVLLIGADPNELSIRAKVLGLYPRPHRAHHKEGVPLIYGDLQIYPIGGSVKYKRANIKFTRTEFNILYLLASNPGQVISRYEIYTSVWHDLNHYDFDIEKNVNKHVQTVRIKLYHGTKYNYIQTVRSAGYSFTPPDYEE